MNLLETLIGLRDMKFSDDTKNSIAEFGKGFQIAGKYYKCAGEITETVGKALEKTECVDEIFNCITDVKNRIVDVLILIADKNEEEIDHIERCAENFTEELKAATEEITNDMGTKDDTESSRAAA